MATLVPDAPLCETDDSRPQRSLARAASVQALTAAGQWAVLVTCQTQAVYRLGQGAGYLTLLTACGTAPLLASRLLGRACDRYGPVRLGVAASLTSTVLAVVAACTVRGPASLLVIAATVAVVRALAQAAADTLPSWLPDIESAAKSSIWMALSQAGPMIVGPSLAASLTVSAGPHVALLATGLLAAVAAVVLATTTTQRPEESDGSSRAPLGATARRVLAASAVTVTTYAVLEALQPLYLHSIDHAPAWALAVNDSIEGVCSVVAGLALNRRPALVDRPSALPVGLVAVAVGEVLVVATPSAAVSAVGSAAWGAAVALLSSAARVRLLGSVPKDQHGSAMGTLRSLWGLASLVSAAAIGPLSAAIGPQAVVAVLAALLAASTLLVLRTPHATESEMK